MHKFLYEDEKVGEKMEKTRVSKSTQQNTITCLLKFFQVKIGKSHGQKLTLKAFHKKVAFYTLFLFTFGLMAELLFGGCFSSAKTVTEPNCSADCQFCCYQAGKSE